MAARKAFSGARAVLRIGDVDVGWATGVQGAEQIDYQPIEQLGEIDTIEFEPVARRVTFSASMVRIIDEGLQAQGFHPKSGQNTTADVINFAPMTMEIYDNIDGKVIYKIEGCKPTTRNWTVDRGGIMTVNADFVATRMLSEGG
jgi:hypothetical protein